jgi:hypothetical protein
MRPGQNKNNTKELNMRKFLMISAAVATLGAGAMAPTAAQAEDAGTVVGGSAGAVTGGTIGFLLGGPVGAVIGGATGAAVGASVLSSADIRSGDIDVSVGAVVADDVRLRPIQDDPDYGYFEANGNLYIVDLYSREIVEVRAS